MRFSLLLCTAIVMASCSSPAELDERWSKPENIQYAAALGIDLAQMQRTATGLYIQDIVVGTGATAVAREASPYMTVRVHYTGWLPDGTVFDTSRDDVYQPIEFPLGFGVVIRGWDEGIAGMNVGGKRRLVIPPHLAYGRRGKGSIPPLTTIIFDVELVYLKP